MPPGSARHVDRLSRLVSDLRSGGAEEGAWPDLMARFGDYLGAMEVTLGGGSRMRRPASWRPAPTRPMSRAISASMTGRTC